IRWPLQAGHHAAVFCYGHRLRILLSQRTKMDVISLCEFAKAVRRRNKFSSTRFAPVNAGGQKWLILIISGSR
ncbi:MAG: hypothetical protein WAO14_26975, partial [Pseudolabrys sp.]